MSTKPTTFIVSPLTDSSKYLSSTFPANLQWHQHQSLQLQLNLAQCQLHMFLNSTPTFKKPTPMNQPLLLQMLRLITPSVKSLNNSLKYLLLSLKNSSESQFIMKSQHQLSLIQHLRLMIPSSPTLQTSINTLQSLPLMKTSILTTPGMNRLKLMWKSQSKVSLTTSNNKYQLWSLLLPLNPMRFHQKLSTSSITSHLATLFQKKLSTISSQFLMWLHSLTTLQLFSHMTSKPLNTMLSQNLHLLIKTTTHGVNLLNSLSKSLTNRLIPTSHLKTESTSMVRLINMSLDQSHQPLLIYTPMCHRPNNSF